jgi:hypothetical protein
VLCIRVGDEWAESVFRSSENSHIVGLTIKTCFGTLVAEASIERAMGNKLGGGAVIPRAWGSEVLGLEPEHSFKFYS